MTGQLLKPASISVSTISCGKRTSPRPPQRGERPATVSPRVFRVYRRTNAPKCCGGTPPSSISSKYAVVGDEWLVASTNQIFTNHSSLTTSHYFEEVGMEIWTDSQMASIHK